MNSTNSASLLDISSNVILTLLVDWGSQMDNLLKNLCTYIIVEFVVSFSWRNIVIAATPDAAVFNWLVNCFINDIFAYTHHLCNSFSLTIKFKNITVIRNAVCSSYENRNYHRQRNISKRNRRPDLVLTISFIYKFLNNLRA